MLKYLILGAGPAGLAFASALRRLGEDNFLILEKEDAAGGLCRSVEVDHAAFDIGGGHFLDVKDRKVTDFLFQYMPEDEWNLFDRDSRIDLGDALVQHPLEANIWQLDIEEQVAYLKSIVAAGCNMKVPEPELFRDWIYWKLGDRIAEKYMIPYNQKMFGEDLDRLGTYWLDKLPDVSFEETLLSCLARKPYGKQPGHARFYYPKHYGYGELWLRMADAIKDRIAYGKRVRRMDFERKTVTAEDGSVYAAGIIVTTVPWLEWETLGHMPEEIVQQVRRLRHTAIRTEYFPERMDTDAHWIYYPDLRLSYHRILVRHNFLPGSRGYWTETNAERVGMSGETGHFNYINTYAYPLNTLEKPETMKRLLGWCADRGVYGLGRWGEHAHHNSDVVVRRAMELAEKLHESR